MPTSIRFLLNGDRIKLADRVGVSGLSCYEIALAQKRGRSALLSKVHQLIWLASIKKQKESLPSFPSVNNPEKSHNKPRKTVTTKNNEQEKNMSIENARAFHERVATDETFREQIDNAANDEEGQNIIRGAGYDFTAEDWNTVTEQLSQSDESELSDAELKAVAGGCSLRFTWMEEGIKAFVKKHSGKQER